MPPDLPGVEPTAAIVKRLERAMAEAAGSAADPGMVQVRIYDVRRLITEWERRRD